MQVKFLAGPKQGKTEHIANDAGRALVAAGLAEEIKPRTMDEFFRQHAVAGPGGCNSPVPFVAEVTWDISQAPGPGAAKDCLFLRRRFQSEQLLTDNPDAALKNGAPKELVAQYKRLMQLQ